MSQRPGGTEGDRHEVRQCSSAGAAVAFPRAEDGGLEGYRSSDGRNQQADGVMLKQVWKVLRPHPDNLGMREGLLWMGDTWACL